MTYVHGKSTNITIATKDISPFTTNSKLDRGGTSHDTTPYGVDDETSFPGLKKHAFECEGTYDNTAVTGPRAVLRPLLMTTVAVVRKPEGTGTGRPMETFNAILESYVETNPSTDMVKWSAGFKVTGPIADTTQP